MTDKRAITLETAQALGDRLIYELDFLRQFAPDMMVKLRLGFQGKRYVLTLVLLGDDEDDYD